MSRFVLGNCIDVMARIPDNAIDFILTDPPYLVGFRDRQGRTIAGDVNDDWLQPASNEMYRVLKKDALMVSFYGWNRIDRFMAAWKRAGFSVAGHLVFIDRNLKPEKIKKTPKNGCLFNTACVP
ncbi:DNA modification methylase [Escherichia coli]|nr:DNA modification methylase [Escherichia coli]